MPPRPTLTRALASLGAPLLWFALAMQLNLSGHLMQARGLSALDGLARFLAFFTVLANILALALGLVAADKALSRR